MLHVVEIHLQAGEHLLDRIRVAVVERGQREESRAHGIQQLVARIVLHDLVDKDLSLGSMAYKRHVAPQDIPKLGQLVEVVIADKAADACQALVAVVVELSPVGLGLDDHRTEFMQREGLAVATDALLMEKSGASILPFDGNPDDEHQPGEDKNACNRANNVERALAKT